MPQNRRKKPFSAKQKRDQLQKKRERQRDKKSEQYDENEVKKKEFEDSCSSGDEQHGKLAAAAVVVSKLHAQPAAQRGGKNYDPNRYRLHFAQESAAEIEGRKADARLPVERLPETALEVRYEDVYQPGSVLDMPSRPSWTFSMSKDQLERKEAGYFRRYLEKIFEEHDPSKLSYFEQNLETWRQLWRVLEMSSIIVLIADIRHPVLHFPPTLYKRVVEEQKKQLVLVLNKVDLIPAPVVIAWCEYFRELFPNLHIIPYTARPGASVGQGGLLSSRKRGHHGNMMCVAGAQQLMRAVAELYQSENVLAGWCEKVQKACEVDGKQDDADEDEEEEGEEIPPVSSEQSDGSGSHLLTIGLVGHPNVGKSSLLNSLVGKKVVSCSRTPGHTKHFQTIHLSEHIRLCDSPGLVFPSLVEKQLQILAGMYPVSQVREPYTAIAYLARRTPLVQLLGLTNEVDSCHAPTASSSAVKEASEQNIDGGEEGTCQNRHAASRGPLSASWSAWAICEAWAVKRGYYTAKAARPDVYRAANELLRLAIDGRVCMYMRPPDYHTTKDKWENHERVGEIRDLQGHGLSSDVAVTMEIADSVASGESEDESSDDDAQPTTSRNPFAALAESSDSA